ELLSIADRYEEALAIAADGLAAAQRDQQGWAYQVLETAHGRMLLRTGRLSEARAVLEGRFALEDGTHAAAVLDAAGIVALGRLAIHTGDTRQARRLGDIAQVMLEQGTPAVRRHAGLAARDLRDGQRRRRSGTKLAARTVRPGRPSDPAAVPTRHRRRSAARAHRSCHTRRRARAARALHQPAASGAEHRHRLAR